MVPLTLSPDTSVMVPEIVRRMCDVPTLWIEREGVEAQIARLFHSSSWERMNGCLLRQTVETSVESSVKTLRYIISE